MDKNLSALLSFGAVYGSEAPYSYGGWRKVRGQNNVGQREAKKLRNRKANKVARESRKINGHRGRRR